MRLQVELSCEELKSNANLEWGQVQIAVSPGIGAVATRHALFGNAESKGSHRLETKDPPWIDSKINYAGIQ